MGGGMSTINMALIAVIAIVSIIIVIVIYLFFCRPSSSSSDDDVNALPAWFSKQSARALVYRNSTTNFALEVRNMPDVFEPPIGTIGPGDRVIVLAEHLEWYKIQMQPQWNDGTVPVVWALKWIVDHFGKAHEILAIAEEAVSYPTKANIVNAPKLVHFPYISGDAAVDLNATTSSDFGELPNSVPESPMVTNSSFVLGDTVFGSPTVTASGASRAGSSTKTMAWSNRPPSLSPPPAQPPIYTPNALHLQAQAMPPMSSTPKIPTTPKPDYTPMITAGAVAISPMPKMAALSPMPKVKMTASSPLRNVLGARSDFTKANGKVYDSPMTQLMHGSNNRWSSPVGPGASFTPLHNARRSSLKLVQERIEPDDEYLDIVNENQVASPVPSSGVGSSTEKQSTKL